MTTWLNPLIHDLVAEGIEVGTYIRMSDPATGVSLSGTVKELRSGTVQTTVTVALEFLSVPRNIHSHDPART